MKIYTIFPKSGGNYIRKIGKPANDGPPDVNENEMWVEGDFSESSLFFPPDSPGKFIFKEKIKDETVLHLKSFKEIITHDDFLSVIKKPEADIMEWADENITGLADAITIIKSLLIFIRGLNG